MTPDGRPEAHHVDAVDLGTGTTAGDVDVILGAHEAVLPALRSAQPSIVAAIDFVVDALAAGGRLVYVGAGTSGWLAALDAAEVIVTYGMAGRVASVVGGGLTLDPAAMTLGDDDVDSLEDDPIVAGCGAGDVAVAVSASGSTPFTVAAVERMRAGGASVIAVVSQPGSPLAALADIEVCVPTGGEVVAGSTRLTAGLAQKVLLNALSTASMIRLGRSHRGQMVCVEPLNAKLRQRLVRAVAIAADADEESARSMLDACGQGDAAVVALVAGVDAAAARARLERCGGNIRQAIESPPT